MFQTWRIKLREVAMAHKHGRIDEAARMLTADNLRQYQPGLRLAASIAESFAERALRRARAADRAAAWRDYEAARSLVGETEQLAAVRSNLVEADLTLVEQRLAIDDTAGALKLIAELESVSAENQRLRRLRDVARQLESARQLARRGNFGEADQQLQSAALVLPHLNLIGERRQAGRELADVCRGLEEKLHQAMVAADWSQALSLADQIIEVAPEHPRAVDARRRAWALVQSQPAGHRQLAETTYWNAGGNLSASAMCVDEPEADDAARSRARFLLWVDAVGGYLVCLGDDVVLGQSLPENRVDVPILADISRKHARIKRQGESYVLQPIGPVRVEGTSITEPTLLADGDEIELGRGVRLRFRKPHALSASARLEFVSRHRTQPWADGVLLMAESCVLGPKWHNHVVCRDWSDDVVLYRQQHDLYCRTMAAVEIDGKICDGRGRIGFQSHVAGVDFSLSLEELDKCTSQPLR